MKPTLHHHRSWASTLFALCLLPTGAQAQTNLQAEVNGSKVDLSWELPTGMNDVENNGFEDDTFPGEGWTVQTANGSDYRCTWFHYPTDDFSQFDNYTDYIHTGSHSAMVFMDLGTHPDGSSANQDEWLISPPYDNATNLEFYSYIDPMVLEYDTYEGYDDHYYVKVSHDGGNTWQVIWDARTQCSPDGGWQLVSLPLGAATPDTRIAFHAVSGKASATDHLYFLWAIDDVRISGPAPAAPISKAASTTSFGGYNIYLDGQLIAGSINARQYTDVSEKAEGEHTYRVAFYDALTDEESEGVQTTVNILAPTFDAPLNVQVSSRYDSEQGYTAVITWDEPQGNQKPEGYIVYCNGMWAGYGITETSFENTGLTKGVYEYKVSAMYDNPSGESEAVGDVIAIGTRMPVTQLSAELGDNGQVELSWQAPADRDHSVKGYNVYRSTTAIATGITTCTYTDTAVPQGQFDYTVTAVYDDDVESMPSAVSISNGTMPVHPLPFSETFDTPFKPADWTVENLYQYTEDFYVWRFDDWFEMNINGNGFDGYYASIDGISAGWAGIMAHLVTPPLSTAHEAGQTLTLSYDLDYLSMWDDCEAFIEYSTDRGASWQDVEMLTPYHDTDLEEGATCSPVHITHDVTNLSDTGEIMFRWYYSGNMDGHIAIDNVRLEATGTTGISQATTDHQPLTVYTTQGVKVAETNGATPALPAGVYIFRQNGHTVKKTVK